LNTSPKRNETGASIHYRQWLKFNVIFAGDCMPRLDTKLESEGAEFLVLGQLLVQRIPTYKTYTNMPGYDLLATNPATNRAARIQVKSRWRTGAPGFLIKNFDCEFVVVVRLNRGNKNGGGNVLPPDFFVLPVSTVQAIHKPGNWSKVFFRDIEGLDGFRDNWQLVADFLAQAPVDAKQNKSSKPTPLRRAA
jgi:hypothetical protein